MLKEGSELAYVEGINLNYKSLLRLPADCVESSWKLILLACTAFGQLSLPPKSAQESPKIDSGVVVIYEPF